MRNLLPALLLAAAIPCRLCAAGAGASSPPDAWIAYLLDRGDSLLASTSDGIYRASLDTKTWKKLPTPSSMPPCGRLVQQDAKSPLLLYFAPMPYFGSLVIKKLHSDWEPCLFFSKDAGQTWDKLAAGWSFENAFIHPNGSIFASVERHTPTLPAGETEVNGPAWTTINGEKQYIYERIVVSRDQGRTWTEISKNTPAAFGFYGFFQDPDHPDLVCFQGAGKSHLTRSVVFQADNDTFDWKMTPASDWKGGVLTDGPRFEPFVSGALMNMRIHAMLSNFFTFPFSRAGEYGPELPIVRAATAKPAYTFRAHEPMKIPIKVDFRIAHPAIKILDTSDETAFWGVKVAPAGGRGKVVEERVSELLFGWPDLAERTRRYFRDPNLSTITVDENHPYERTVDLSKFHDFSHPGTYRVMVYHDDQPLVKWGGGFGSDAFEVTVTN